MLHPIENHVGRPILVEGGLDDVASTIPTEIAPQLQIDGVLLPMFGTDFTRLRISLDEGDLAVDFDGDTWEVEDQRNWTDASFKSYSTPLRLGTHDATAGEVFSQVVTLRFAAAPESEPLSDPLDAVPPSAPHSPTRSWSATRWAGCRASASGPDRPRERCTARRTDSRC